jgi:Domain of unknown function (DUF4177)
MKTVWQHKAIQYSVPYGLFGSLDFDANGVAKELDRQSQDGWELVTILPLGSGTTQNAATERIVLMLRRPAPVPPELPSHS